METAGPPPTQLRPRVEPRENESGLFSSESVLNLQKLIFAGSPLCEVLAIIAQLVESQVEGMFCTIWLPDQDGKELYCAAAPSLPGFSSEVGLWLLVRKADPAGTAFYRKESVYVTDILTDPIWENYRDRMLPFLRMQSQRHP